MAKTHAWLSSARKRNRSRKRQARIDRWKERQTDRRNIETCRLSDSCLMKMYNEFVKCQRIYILFMFISLAYGTRFTDCQPNRVSHSDRQSFNLNRYLINTTKHTHTHSQLSSINRCRGTCSNFIGIFKYVLLLCTRFVYAMLVASCKLHWHRWQLHCLLCGARFRSARCLSVTPVCLSVCCVPACLSICLFVCPSLFALKELQWWRF